MQAEYICAIEGVKIVTWYSVRYLALTTRPRCPHDQHLPHNPRILFATFLLTCITIPFFPNSLVFCFVSEQCQCLYKEERAPWLASKKHPDYPYDFTHIVDTCDSVLIVFIIPLSILHKRTYILL